MIDTEWLAAPCETCGAKAGEFCGGDCKPGEEVHGSRLAALRSPSLKASLATPPPSAPAPLNILLPCPRCGLLQRNPTGSAVRGRIDRVSGTVEGGRGYELRIVVEKEPGAPVPPEHMPGRAVTVTPAGEKGPTK